MTDAPAADIRPTAPRRLLVALIVTELMITFALATPIVATLGLKVQEIAPDRKEQVLATVMAVGSIAALLLNPVFGHLSDRTTGRFGRRRPWIAGGLVVGLPAGAVMATAHSTTQLVLGWLLAQAAYNAALAALSAVIADRVPAGATGHHVRAVRRRRIRRRSSPDSSWSERFPATPPPCS